MNITKRALSCSGLKNREHIMGESVSATMPETATAPARVKANSVKRLPVRPPWKPMGTYTATSTTVMARMGPPSSRAAMREASSGVFPSFMWRSAFSTTMMASSTTRPMASTRASSVSRLMEYPRASITKKVPTRDSGMAITGTATARKVPRKR